VQWKVLKSVPLTEVQNRLRDYEDRHGSLSLLHDEFTKGRMPPGMFDDYVEWTSMNHAIRAYQEGEDFEYLAEEDLKLSIEDYAKLTPKRLMLLDHLIEGHTASINELASTVNRDVKNVYNDLKTLESLGLINLVKMGRRLVPEPLVYEITILLG
jgi:predicted transcriptional regulator